MGMGDKRTDGKEEINAMNYLCEYVMSPQEGRERERERTLALKAWKKGLRRATWNSYVLGQYELVLFH